MGFFSVGVLSLLLTTLLAVSALRVEAQPTLSPEQVARMEVPKGALFKATKDGKVIHLFGTIHVAPENFLPLGSQTIKSLSESEVLLLELDFLNPNLASDFDQYSKADKPVTLTNRQREIVTEAATTMNTPPDKLLAMKPLMIASTITLAEGQKVGLRSDYGSDLFLLGAAMGMKIPVVGMETIQEQLKMLDNFSPSEVDQMMKEMFSDIESKRVPQLLKDMTNAWFKGDLDELARVSEINKTEVNRKVMAATNKRNVVMIEKIILQSSMANKPIFAAAGALHFWGDESITNLLKKRGYTIERIH